jgi:hypothetical protein
MSRTLGPRGKCGIRNEVHSVWVSSRGDAHVPAIPVRESESCLVSSLPRNTGDTQRSAHAALAVHPEFRELEEEASTQPILNISRPQG